MRRTALLGVVLMLALSAATVSAQFGPRARTFVPIVQGGHGGPAPAPTATRPAPTATQSAPTTTPGVQQLLLNPDFELGTIGWTQSTNGFSHTIIQDGAGRLLSWGAEFGGRYGAEDMLRQTVSIPEDISDAFLSFWLKMESYESTTEVQSNLVVAIYDRFGSLLEVLATFDNTDTRLMWQLRNSANLGKYAGHTIQVVFTCVTNGLTTFYVDDTHLLVGYVTPVPPTATQPPSTATQAAPTATTVPATATTVPPTVSPEPTACNTNVQLVQNPSFEWDGDWMIGAGIPARSTTTAHSGSYSMLFGGYNNALDFLGQTLPSVPQWAEWGGLCASWRMVSDESGSAVYDYLDIRVLDISDPDNLVLVGNIHVSNMDSEMVWQEECVGLLNVPSLRGRPLGLAISAITDSQMVTGWYVDEVHVIFGCGAGSGAGLTYEALVPGNGDTQEEP